MMFVYYYFKNAEFKNLFGKLKTSSSLSYEKHVDKHNVIFVTRSNSLKLYKTFDEYNE